VPATMDAAGRALGDPGAVDVSAVIAGLTDPG
jgi:hypothetical protein